MYSLITKFILNIHSSMENSCIYNAFKCKFCNHVFDESPARISKHYGEDCVNENHIVRCPLPDHEPGTGYQFKIHDIDIKPTLVIIGDHYYVMVVPKRSDNKINFMIFSTESKYRKSNYQITISNSSNTKIFDNDLLTNIKRNIIYKQFVDNIVPLESFIDPKTSRTMSFTIQNQFLLKSHISRYEIGDVRCSENTYIEGEPGSPGNWSKEDYDDLTKKFKDLFANRK